jgi:hypothetical protein
MNYANTTFFKIGVTRCNPKKIAAGKTCKSASDTQKFIDQNRPQMFIITGKDYVDSFNFSFPVKTLLDSISIAPMNLVSEKEYTATIVNI